jgi:dipeptide/tripeptide permease
LCYTLIINNFLLNYIFLALFILIAYVLIKAGVKEDKKNGESIWKDRMIALIIFMIINIVFWACFEQAGTSLTLFADRNIDRNIFGWEMPASMTQFFNPFFIIVFGSLFSVMWVKLSKIGKNPNIPMKFAFGVLQLGLGFLLTYVGFQLSTDNLVPLFILILLYMLHTTGELFLSPIGLSMVTKLSPKNMAGTAMGAWFLSFAIANLLGGQIATLTGGGHGGNQNEDKTKFSLETTVKEGFMMLDNPEGFDKWLSLKDLPKNISYEKWFDINDWVEMREGLTEKMTLSDWLSNKRTIEDTIQDASEWLSENKWNQLNEKYTRFLEEDGMSQKDWGYYKGGIDTLSVANNVNFDVAIDEMVSIKQKSGLNKYIDVFTKIGFVLIFISLLIAIVSKPIKKLMHGVE